MNQDEKIKNLVGTALMELQTISVCATVKPDANHIEIGKLYTIEKTVESLFRTTCFILYETKAAMLDLDKGDKDD